jgi:hypothetical protein
MIRGLAWALAVLFVAATILQLVHQLNLVAQPPDLPESTNLVDRVLGGIPYQQAIWPLFFITNLLIGLGFLVVTALGFALMGATADPDLRVILGASLVAGGILGAAGQALLLGSVKAAIDIPYCDCGFKEQEIVSQVWALMVTRSASDMFVSAAGLLAATGIAAAGNAFRERMGDRWRVVSWLVAAVLVLYVVAGFYSVSDDLLTFLSVLTPGILIPVWAIWLGVGFASQRPEAA